MPVSLNDDELKRRIAALKAHGYNKAAAAAYLGIAPNALGMSLRSAEARGLISPDDWRKPREHSPIEMPQEVDSEKLITELKKKPMTLDEIASKLGITRGNALDALDGLVGGGVALVESNGLWSIKRADQQPAFLQEELPIYTSREDGTYYFGVATDTHLCSKYSRLDVLNELYDQFEKRKVDRVFNCGNWIDGEARFNVHDLIVHGLEGQLDYLAENYPRKNGLVTYAIAGDDHEGWYAQRFGIDIGKRAEQTMRAHGRQDWVNLGYMEAHVRLVHAKTGASTIMAIVHPGGGSAYALTYSIQKWIESLDGGEKPAVALFGHYHKMEAHNDRNVWAIQCGTVQDQTPFMRKKKLQAHVGGVFVRLHQDAESGAILECETSFRRYFNRGWSNNRWSHFSPISPLSREVNVA